MESSTLSGHPYHHLSLDYHMYTNWPDLLPFLPEPFASSLKLKFYHRAIFININQSLHCRLEFYTVWSLPTLAISLHLLKVLQLNWFFFPGLQMFKAHSCLHLCTCYSPLGLTFSCGWSSFLASNLLNCHLRISDHSCQSSVPKHNCLTLYITMFLSSIVLTHCANTLSYFFSFYCQISTMKHKLHG